jgi:hypothetical protein
VPFKTNIVVSNDYEENIDNIYVIIYVSQGVKDHHGNEKQVYGQQLTPENALALLNSWMKKQCVILIRSFEEFPCGYRYD